MLLAIFKLQSYRKKKQDLPVAHVTLAVCPRLKNPGGLPILKAPGGCPILKAPGGLPVLKAPGGCPILKAPGGCPILKGQSGVVPSSAAVRGSPIISGSQG